MTTQPPDWDAIYAANTPPPWDIGRPQPAFVRLARRGLLCGRVLDVGCGTGEHALLAAAHGADAVGVDMSPRAVEQARGKAAARGVTARFEVASALNLRQLAMTFDTVIDSGLFHVFDDEGRARYVTSLAAVMRSGGSCYLMCFSDRQPGDWGPRRVRQDELVAAFGEGWNVTSIAVDAFAINPGFGTPAEAWLATICVSDADVHDRGYDRTLRERPPGTVAASRQLDRLDGQAQGPGDLKPAGRVFVRR
jgi:SAM-dependent methyltransferase